MASIRILAISIGCSTLLYAGAWPCATASAQVVERGVEGAAVGAIIGGIVGGGRGAGTGAAIGGGLGVLSGAAEANARAHGYYGPPPGYGPPPPGYYGPPPPRYYRPPHAGYYGPPRAAVALSITTAPPPLPVYEQPLCPGSGYIWTPGYWAYAGDYYWVPGTWVLPPAVGLVWTPGYWGYDGQRYVWNTGYWGPHVGYYGGINYGFGYVGSGYEGGYWDNGVFFYNSAVTKIDAAVITHTYNKSVVNTATVNNVSFNGAGGTTVKPTPEEVTWSHEKHASPTALQVKHQRTASTNHSLFASVNHGAPPIAATDKPAVFKAPEKVGPKMLAGTNPTSGPGATGQGSVDERKNGTEQKRLPQGPTAPLAKAESEPESHASGGRYEPNKRAPLVNEETSPNWQKHTPGDQGPGGASASGEPKPDTTKYAPAGRHAVSDAFTGKTESGIGKHAPGNGSSQPPGEAHKPGSQGIHGGTPVAQDGAQPHDKKKHDQDHRPEPTQGM